MKSTVFSSNDGATIDGQGSTGLFELRGGCGLTLRGVKLVNGRATLGGIIDAMYAGDITLADSIVIGCRTTDVRRCQ